jgi:hypothetical protein
VRKLIKIALVALGIRALLRWWKGRRAQEAAAPASPPPTDPADELRRKLAETRGDAGADASAEPPETPSASVADRRAAVHEEGRAALDEMKQPDKG